MLLAGLQFLSSFCFIFLYLRSRKILGLYRIDDRELCFKIDEVISQHIISTLEYLYFHD
jgi:hypothetical protein